MVDYKGSLTADDRRTNEKDHRVRGKERGVARDGSSLYEKERRGESEYADLTQAKSMGSFRYH